MRTATRPGSEGLARAVEKALAAVDGVDWARVNGIVGRVLVVFDGDAVDLGTLVEVVEAVEEAHGHRDEGFSAGRPEHAGDVGPSRRALAGLVADVLGLGAAVAGSLLRASPLPIELASVVTLVDSQPRLRRLVEDAVGGTVADVGLATVNALGQALAQGPVGLVVDGVQRGVAVVDARARRAAWVRHPALHVSPEPTDHGVDPIRLVPRPVELPPGPAEVYCDRAGMVSLLGAGAALVGTGDARRALAVLLAGAPKAARAGREVFAGLLGKELADRDVVVADIRALRRLDRIDTLVVAAGAVDSGEVEVGKVELIGEVDHVVVETALRTLLDPRNPHATRTRGQQRLVPLGEAEVPMSLEVRRAMRRLPSGGVVVVLVDHDRWLALALLQPRLVAGAEALVAAARRAGLMVVAETAGGVDVRLGVDLSVAAGQSLLGTVRDLQADGCVVCLVADGDATALAASDVGLGVSTAGSPVWGAHVMFDSGLNEAVFVVESMLVAHEVSRQSAALALAGSSAGSLLAVSARSPSAGRAMLAVNVAAIVAVGNAARAAAALAARPRRTARIETVWHALTVDEVVDRLPLVTCASARPSGPLGRPGGPLGAALRAVVEEMANPLTPVLAGGAVASSLVGSTGDAWVIGAVVVLNALIGAWQRLRAEQAVGALEQKSAGRVEVLNGDSITLLVADSLVPGMRVRLHAGSVVPADCRVLEAAGVELDEATLTGESLPVTKSSQACPEALVAERTCMLYEGTTVVAGEVTAVVVAIGADTEAGRSDDEEQPSARGGVDARLARLSALTLPVAAAGGAAVVGLGLLRGQPLRRTLGAGVSLAVAAVPEGLPVLATTAQLAAARRLAGRGALVRNPRAIEALGRIDVLCTDKTGTLTEGRIRLHTVSDGHNDTPVPDLTAVELGVLAAARRATPSGDGHTALAHPTDQAVVDAAREADVTPTIGASGWRLLREVPFEPGRGYHATIGRTDAGQSMDVKGAPEVVLPACTSWRPAGRPRPLRTSDRQKVNATVERLARQGLRILAVAGRHQPTGADDSSTDRTDLDLDRLELIGLLAFADPVRPTAAAAVDGLRRAGVQVVMVTGDHPSTAEGIAVELGLLEGRTVLTGDQLSRLDDPSLIATLPSISVFARVTPSDKVRIVRAYQQAGRAVAMTGDGANDAAAIRRADVGIAVGARCTPAARAAADLIITGDRIETIVDAIVEGRAMWASVRDALAILLGGNLGEIGFTVAAAAITGRAPLTSRQILLVNLLTDVAPATAIAVRPPPQHSYEALLDEGPDRSLGATLNRAIAIRAVTTAAGTGAAWAVASVTGTPKRASTTALIALVGTQLGQTLMSGGHHPSVLLTSFGSAAILAVIVQTPIISQTFGCSPLDPLAWATAVGAATAATGLSWAAQRLLRPPSPRSTAASPVDATTQPGAAHPAELVTA